MNIGVNVRKCREAAGWTQRQLSEVVGVSHSMLGQIERGSKGLTVALAVEISKALGCELIDLIKGVDM